MKSIITIVALAFSLSLCNLTERLTNSSRSNANTEPANSQSANKSNTNGSSVESGNVPPSPTSNGNSDGVSGSAVAGGALEGKAISLPKPVYPPIARAAKASGVVVVQVEVDEAGKVITADAQSGHPLLRASAVQAARQARFTPTVESGKPVKVRGTITYNFQP